MKPTDWYTRLLLSASTLLLLVIAAELHWANRLQAAAGSPSQPATAAQGGASGVVSASWSQPTQLNVAGETRVRIVGYEYNGRPVNIGSAYDNVRALPVLTK